MESTSQDWSNSIAPRQRTVILLPGQISQVLLTKMQTNLPLLGRGDILNKGSSPLKGFTSHTFSHDFVYLLQLLVITSKRRSSLPNHCIHCSVHGNRDIAHHQNLWMQHHRWYMDWGLQQKVIHIQHLNIHTDKLLSSFCGSDSQLIYFYI